MPRVTAAHEQEVRDRIVTAAVRVFSDKGFHSATIADVCRESGLSVGRDLHLLLEQGRALPPELRPDRRARSRRAGRATRPCHHDRRADDHRDRALHRDDRRIHRRPGPDLAAPGLGGGGTRTERPSDARGATRAPGRGRPVPDPAGDGERRAAVVARRRRRHPWASSGCSTGCCSSASRPATPTGRPTCSDGPARCSSSSSPAPARHARTLPDQPVPSERRANPRGPSRPRSIAADGARPDRPRPDRSRRARVHPAPRAHPDRALAHRGALGLLATDPRSSRSSSTSSASSAPPAAARSST